MGELRMMGPEGDVRVMWDPSNADEVATAKQNFDELRAKGHLAYKVDRKGEPGEMIRAFDAQAGKIILAPQMAGG